MTRIIKWLPAAALTIGPSAAYLAWAITRRRIGHIILALLLNITLWTAGPAFISFYLHHAGILR